MNVGGQNIGPRRPLPFPDGSKYKLAQCPTCKQKGMVLFNAPSEHGYPTKCLKCGQLHVVKRKDSSLTDIQRAGGFTPQASGIRHSQRWGYDATKFYDEQRLLKDLGIRKAYQNGAIARSVDSPLRLS